MSCHTGIAGSATHFGRSVAAQRCALSLVAETNVVEGQREGAQQGDPDLTQMKGPLKEGHEASRHWKRDTKLAGT